VHSCSYGCDLCIIFALNVDYKILLRMRWTDVQIWLYLYCLFVASSINICCWCLLNIIHRNTMCAHLLSGFILGSLAVTVATNSFLGSPCHHSWRSTLPVHLSTPWHCLVCPQIFTSLIHIDLKFQSYSNLAESHLSLIRNNLNAVIPRTVALRYCICVDHCVNWCRYTLLSRDLYLLLPLWKC